MNISQPITCSPLSSSISLRLTDVGLDPVYVENLVQQAIAEDLAGGIDVTSVATVPISQRSVASFGSRAHGVLAGLDVACAVMQMVCGEQLGDIERLKKDGDTLEPGDVVARVIAPTQLLLTAERTALNLMCHLSGIATATAKWVSAVEGTHAVIRDTRKTTPGLRMLEKYAVRCGGGRNHRMSLSDAALVKDNHIASAGGVVEAFAAVRSLHSDIAIEVEVDTLDQLREVIAAGADLVLLDNMTPDVMREAVAIAAQHATQSGRNVLLEASGGLSLDNARAVAQTGVHFISVGAITHSSPILDLGLDVEVVLSH
jgi:nicotinate-nucleotide pyrophosphorylase (carboxylating)